jgi:hypothetical protein
LEVEHARRSLAGALGAQSMIRSLAIHTVAWLTAVALVTSSLGCHATVQSVSTELEPPYLLVMKRCVDIDGARLTLPCPESELTAVLGPPSRVEQLENRVLVWDERGVYAYVTPTSGQVHALTVSYQCADASFCPHSPYQGELIVGQVHLYPFLFHEAQLRRAGFEPDDLGLWARGFGRHTIIIQPDEQHQRIDSVEIGD